MPGEEEKKPINLDEGVKRWFKERTEDGKQLKLMDEYWKETIN